VRRLALLLVLLGLALPAPAQAAFPGKNGKIAFSSARNGFPSDEDIWTTKPDGTDQQRLTSLRSNEFDAAWSPDGSRLLFTNDFLPSTGSIYVINADGSGLKLLSYGGNPAWSPDGKRIVFESFPGLVLMNADGSGRTSIPIDLNANNIRRADNPVWSPDGTKIAFQADRPDDVSADVYTVAPDVSELENLTKGEGRQPDWSPDGTKIVYVGAVLATLNADGTGYTPLTNGRVFDRHPSWSPDGTKIAFTGASPRSFGTIWTTNPQGSATAPLLDGSYFDSDPDWQPIPGPKRSDYKNSARFCDAERNFLGEGDFARKYGTNGNGANAFGKCVSQNR
jgi:Tol biopolymer transport system component